MAHRDPRFPKLLFTDEVRDSLKDRDMSQQARDKIVKAMMWLNSYGTRHEYLRKKLEHTGRQGWWAILLTDRTDEWHVMFRKVEGSHLYGMAYLYRKDTNKIPLRVWKTVDRIAKREGWL